MYFRVADWLKAIVLVVIILTVYILVGTIDHTIVLFAIASFITFIITPLINFLTSRAVNRLIAIALTYTLFLGTLALIVFILGPIVTDQVVAFLSDVPEFIDDFRAFIIRIQDFLQDIELFRLIPFNPGTLINQLLSIVADQLRNLILIIPSLLAFLTDLVLIFVLSIYMLIYLPEIDMSIRDSLPMGTTGTYDKFLSSMKTTFGRYLLGQLALMTVVGLLSGIGVWLVGLPFPLLFGLWAGLTEIIPILGPVLGAIPAVIVALAIEPVLALWVILVFIIVQQIEGGLLGPIIFRGAVGLNPLLVIFAIIAGAEIAGILGIFLAVPILALLVSIIRFIRSNFDYERLEDQPDRIVVKN